MNNIEELKQIALYYIDLYEQVENYSIKDNFDCVYNVEAQILKLHKKCQEARKKVNDFSSKEKSDIKPDDNIGSWYDITHNYTLEEVTEALKKQQRAIWIVSPFQNEEDNVNDNYQYECSNCGYGDIHAKNACVPYCWHCGTKIEGEQKNEDTTN